MAGLPGGVAGPLTPSARSGNLIAGDGTKNGLPAPKKELTANPKQPLDRKSPIQVTCEPDLNRRRIRQKGVAPCNHAPSARRSGSNRLDRELLKPRAPPRNRLDPLVSAFDPGHDHTTDIAIEPVAALTPRRRISRRYRSNWCIDWRPRSEGVGFVPDSPLEEGGFELSVPGGK